jgi:hypothetical protein
VQRSGIQSPAMAGRVVHIRPDPGGGWQVGEGQGARTFPNEEQAWVEARRLVANGTYSEVKIHGKRGELTSEFHGDLPIDETAAVRSRDAMVAQERVDLARSEKASEKARSPTTPA